MRRMRIGLVVVVVVIHAVLLSYVVLAQVANPADAAKQSAAAVQTLQSTNDVRYRSWEYPVVVDVSGQKLSPLREENPIGSYDQPLWTATRRFPTTRVYIIPEGKMDVEYWLRTTFKKDGTTAYRSLYEMEFGLPGRFQLDVYYRTDQAGTNGVFVSEQLELRYALADWGEIPGNPTLYLEWIRHDNSDEPDQIEPKLLLGGEVAPRWHWGLNLVGEFQTGGDLEREYSVRGGLSYTALDYKLAVGAECQASFTDVKEDRGNFEKSVVVGPSVQYRPFPQMTLNFAPLFGTTADSPDAQVWFNLGWEL